ncbi:uncharacterized protein B0H18DRAFT_1129818 [Fomitopsis serialis]|uniref:uncharacterized protein n=1 Tax=Fomitopsis serialis TaxID=139415 RepID=UPI002007D588|nr:uncharacterized protein B0H18DRAFT_1129818 [Neoantrodia serialis]KAH9910614.1 hypothetical protein B0H18DRAFT_1129818 [Neoantrodia serialis]
MARLRVRVTGRRQSQTQTETACYPRSRHDANTGDAAASSHIPAVNLALKFIRKLQPNPWLAHERHDAETISRLKRPLMETPDISTDKQLSIKLLLADTDGSEKIYNGVRDAILERFPDCDILSHHLGQTEGFRALGVVAIIEDNHALPAASRVTMLRFSLRLNWARFRPPDGADNMAYRRSVIDGIFAELRETGNWTSSRIFLTGQISGIHA